MLYTSVDALCLAASQLDLEDKENLIKLGELCTVYFTALHNPPVGVIGVGAITYAEQVLINYQLNQVEG